MSGVLNTDGVTPTPVQANPTTHAIDVHDAATGTITARADAHRDDNSSPTLLAYASDGSGIVELAVNSAGKLLVKST